MTRNYICCHLLYYKIALSRVAGGCCHDAATPLVDHGEQWPQSSRQPHDVGVRGGGRVAAACAASSQTDFQIDCCRVAQKAQIPYSIAMTSADTGVGA